jgi:hypothetical protein
VTEVDMTAYARSVAVERANAALRDMSVTYAPLVTADEEGLVADRLGHDLARSLLRRRWDAYTMLLRYRGELRSLGNSIHHDVDQAKQFVAGEPALWNPLGMIARSALEFDRLVASFDIYYDAAVAAEAELVLVLGVQS